MDSLELLSDQIKKRLAAPLPGRSAHLKLAPHVKFKDVGLDPPQDAVPSSVLLLLYPNSGKLTTLLIHRSEYDGVHSGQISLPGGRMEERDLDAQDTALRELEEETGIERHKVNVSGRLSPFYINRSNFLVYPYIGIMDSRPVLKPDPVEVQNIIEVDIDYLLDPATIQDKTLILANGFRLEAPGYLIGEYFMWGATAMIFSEFLEVYSSIARHDHFF
jgi:8-oxo-dGTP pyrophosphatase MutT (NUDIX family)